MSKDKSMNPIPPEVVDESAYKEYLEITQSIEDMGDLDIEVSDDSLGYIKISAPKSKISSKISHLPSDEKSKILLLASKYRKLKSSQTAVRNKAFGFKSGGRYAMQEKLLDNKREEIIELFGKFHAPKEVHEIVNKTWQYGVSLDTVKKFQRDNIDAIEDYQNNHKTNLDDVRLFHKKSRLQEFLELYNKVKQNFNDTNNREDAKLAAQFLKLIREEVEGNKLLIDGKLQIDVEATVAMQVQLEVMKKTKIIDIIMARAAARLGCNPRFLLARMHQSRYSKLTGFDTPLQLNEEDNVNDFLDYPSTHNYDMDKIKEMFYVHERKTKGDMAYEEIEIQEEVRDKVEESRGKIEETIKNLKKPK
jgi:uncharacterized protein YggL (DUF469 family)